MDYRDLLRFEMNTAHEEMMRHKVGSDRFHEAKGWYIVARDRYMDEMEKETGR